MKSRCVNYRLLIAGMNTYALSGITGLYNFGRGGSNGLSPFLTSAMGRRGQGRRRARPLPSELGS